MRTLLLLAALVCSQIGTAFSVNLTAALRPHDGTFNTGKYFSVARQVRASILRNLQLMNQWAPAVRLSAGEYGFEVDSTTLIASKKMARFRILDLAANAGTAVNLLGCRSAPGHDLDFWTLGRIKVAGYYALRIEINGPVPGPAKDNVWVAKEHFKITDTPPHGMHPGDSSLSTTANGLMLAKYPTHVTSYPAQDTEVDIWTDGYEADKSLLKLIRRKFHHNQGMVINLKRRREPGHKYVKVVDFPDLIVQKASLVIQAGRQAKNNNVGWPFTDYSAGKHKFENDARDLYCLCHHYLYAKPYVQNHYRTHGHIAKICAIAFDEIANEVRDMLLVNYNILAHAAETATDGAVGLHMCTGPPDGTCAGGATAPDEFLTLAVIQPILDEYERRER